MGNNNKRYLFRQPALDPEVDQSEFLPYDITLWFNPNLESGRIAGGGLIFVDDISVGGGPGNQLDTDYHTTPSDPPYIPNPPGITAKQPQVISVIKQEVRHDPQGTAYVTVTFSIGPEDSDIEYELKVTKA